MQISPIPPGLEHSLDWNGSESVAPASNSPDTAHEDVINLLVACGILVRSKSHLVTGPKAGELDKLSRVAQENGLFVDVQNAISELEEIILTNNMLEGW